MRKQLSTWAAEARTAWRDRHQPGWRERMIAILDEKQAENDRLRYQLRRAHEALASAQHDVVSLRERLAEIVRN